MEEKFCLSPWRDSCYADDHFHLHTQHILDKRSNIIQFFSARQPRKLNRFRNHTKENKKTEGQGDRKQNTYRLQSIKTTHRSAEVTPTKKEPLKLNTITNNTSLVIGPKRNNSNEKIVKDSHQLLINRFLRLKKEGKLHLKESVGHRILRF